MLWVRFDLLQQHLPKFDKQSGYHHWVELDLMLKSARKRLKNIHQE
jgi:hypothetical protein